ncbi:MAG: hypothetical protein A2Z88_10805 [Omnitrophica WOR_2 bacterium GWA2_47_8]|nr:MAG: hypothetical protein A2Z88_10805 [Omnitrophica WOR_2 bacterium GWA2_47_8]
MRSILSTFNSNIFTSAGSLTVVCIVAIEAALAIILPSKYFSDDVERTLYDIEHVKYNAKKLILGDSMARQIFLDSRFGKEDTPANRVEVGREIFEEHNIGVFPMNSAIEMIGQYFLIQRYLAKNEKPESILYFGRYRDVVKGNLSGNHVEHYVQRCFLKFDEIAQITSLKGIRFGFIMMVYKWMPSHRYRWHLQKQLSGFTTGSIITGVFEGEVSKPEVSHSLLSLKMPNSSFDSVRTSKLYFEKIIALAEREGIDFNFMAAPISEKEYQSRRQRKVHSTVFNYMLGLERDNKYFKFQKSLPVYPDNLFMKDGIHLTEEGVKRAIKEINQR